MVHIIPSADGRPPGRWVHANGAIDMLIFDSSQPETDVNFPGYPVILSIGADLIQLYPWLERRCRF